MILSRVSYRFLRKQVGKRIGNYLEIGVYEGDMLRDFAARWPSKNFYGIDPFIEDGYTTGHNGIPKGHRLERQRAIAYENFNHMPNIKLFEQTSASFLKEKSKRELQEMNVSTVYVDGNHSYDDTLNDLWLAEKLIDGNGLIYIDDFDLPDVLKATRDFTKLNQNRIATHRNHAICMKP